MASSVVSRFKLSGGGENDCADRSSILDRIPRRTKGLFAALVFALVWISLPNEPDGLALNILEGETQALDEVHQRLLQVPGAKKSSNEQDSDQESSDISAFDESKHAVFLISFGQAAAESSLVERCVLSIRRRGAFAGPVVVLTDAPPERYKDTFDSNVFVLHSKEEDMKWDYFEHAAMKYKRFKTLALNYIDSAPELADIESVYYMDIDIIMGAPLAELLEGLHKKYNYQPNTSQDESEDEQIPTFYFFKDAESPIPFFANSGFFIMNRRNSHHCLDLWREEIDSRKDERFDQTSLNALATRISNGDETSCRMVSMDRDNFIYYPTLDGQMLNMVKESSYTNLIHILNSWKAEGLSEKVTEYFVANVLQLSKEERDEKKYGKTVIEPSEGKWTEVEYKPESAVEG